VSEIICPDCGERNAGPVEFCAACGGFLAWDAGDEVPAPAGVAPQAAGLPSAAPIAARSTGSSAQEPRPAGPPQRHATEQPADHQLASAFAAGAPAGAVPQRTLAQPAREWATAQFSGSGFEPSTRTDRHGPPPPAEPPSMLSAPAEPAAPTEAPCPRCGVVNDAALRFCRKCGLGEAARSRRRNGARGGAGGSARVTTPAAQHVPPSGTACRYGIDWFGGGWACWVSARLSLL
jgi:hypothetical protein